MGLKDKDIDELDVEQCKQEMKRIFKLFEAEQYDLTGNFFNPIVASVQFSNLCNALIKAGIIDAEELTDSYFKLFVERLRDMEKGLLPEVRKQRITHMVQQNGPQIFGPNGNPLA